MFIEKSLGIDFRENQLILTFLKKVLTKIRLVDYEVYPLTLSDQKEDREAKILDFINIFISRNQIDKKKIFVSIPRENVLLRFIKLPVSTKENLRKVIEYEIPRYTPFEKSEIYFDHFILKEDKEWLHLIVVFAKKRVIDSYLSLLKKIGIYPIAVEIQTTPAINLFSFNKVVKTPSILIGLNDSFFEINILDDRNEWKESLHIALPEGARELKVVDVLKRLEKDYLNKSSLYLYGLGVDEETLGRIKDIYQENKVYFAPLSRIKMKKVSNPYQIYSSIGLALKGLTGNKININLLPTEMRRRKRELFKPFFIFFTFIGLVLAIIWGVGIYYQHKNELRMINEEIKKRIPGVNAVNNLQKKKDDLKTEIVEFEKLRGEELSKIVILRELTQILPQNVWIWNLKYKANEIEVSGFAESASDLISILDRSSVFEKVEFLSPVTKERLFGIEAGKEKERFKIKAKIESGGLKKL